jgi:hypothetical protein
MLSSLIRPRIRFKSPSVIFNHDEIVLEYRINLLRSEVSELESQRKNLKGKINR